jgi:Fic family protein
MHALKMLPEGLEPEQLESRAVLKKLASARAALAELKGVASSIPNERILIDTLSIQEAKDSSGIENIVTTHDEIYQGVASETRFPSPASKEVYRYAEALKFGFAKVQENGMLNLRLIKEIQAVIEGNNAGFRKQAGTKLINDATEEVVYVPPQDPILIENLMSNLELFINTAHLLEVDPLIKMAIVHHQFESIHPFYDGNGRTGRIINILFLIQHQLLNLPILYLSKYILRHRSEYYRLLQSTRETNEWEEWLIYILSAVEETSIETVSKIKAIKKLMQELKIKIRQEQPRMYSQDLLNNLFRHPYSKIGLLQSDLRISRQTATKYLETLSAMGILVKIKIGRSNYFLNHQLFSLLKNNTQ